MSGSQYHFKRFCRSVSRPLLQQFIAKVAPTLKVDWGTVLVKNVDTLYHAFLELDTETHNRLDLLRSNPERFANLAEQTEKISRCSRGKSARFPFSPGTSRTAGPARLFSEGRLALSRKKWKPSLRSNREPDLRSRASRAASDRIQFPFDAEDVGGADLYKNRGGEPPGTDSVGSL